MDGPSGGHTGRRVMDGPSGGHTGRPVTPCATREADHGTDDPVARNWSQQGERRKPGPQSGHGGADTGRVACIPQLRTLRGESREVPQARWRHCSRSILTWAGTEMGWSTPERAFPPGRRGESRFQIWGQPSTCWERPQMLELRKGHQGLCALTAGGQSWGRDWGWGAYQASVPLLAFNYHCCHSCTNHSARWTDTM